MGELGLTLTIKPIVSIVEAEKNFKEEKKEKLTQFCNF